MHAMHIVSMLATLHGRAIIIANLYYDIVAIHTSIDLFAAWLLVLNSVTVNGI